DFMKISSISDSSPHRQPLSEAPKCHQGEVVRVHVVSKIEMIREASAGKFHFVPASGVILTLQQPFNAPHDGFAEPVFAGYQTNQRPCCLRGGAVAFTLERRVAICGTRFTPSAVGVLN